MIRQEKEAMGQDNDDMEDDEVMATPARNTQRSVYCECWNKLMEGYWVARSSPIMHSFAYVTA
jgi:hypothetical protein